MTKLRNSKIFNGIKKAIFGFFAVIGCLFFYVCLYFVFNEDSKQTKSNYEIGYEAGYEKAKKEFESNQQGEKQ